MSTKSSQPTIQPTANLKHHSVLNNPAQNPRSQKPNRNLPSVFSRGPGFPQRKIRRVNCALDWAQHPGWHPCSRSQGQGTRTPKHGTFGLMHTVKSRSDEQVQ
ncbi:hypothetical protein N7466_006008 [Penicillium verhagenii]|uniref:uncharacterized protein n=1 Tax=Penicillium verhagenii TaxID=1562060 RepID=UPI002545280A|nr:uncharacterized protein N7466_006008 [Penicillium verhagenii]KAJ5930515.1 hypothetical protein N7466_006008 [Penicillium verhagenii]